MDKPLDRIEQTRLDAIRPADVDAVVKRVLRKEPVTVDVAMFGSAI